MPHPLDSISTEQLMAELRYRIEVTNDLDFVATEAMDDLISALQLHLLGAECLV